MKVKSLIVAAILFVFSASAELSNEDAQAKLKERAAAHPPATQPFTSPELVQLRKENAALKAEVATLKTENNTLGEHLQKLRFAAVDESKAANKLNGANEIVKGMTLAKAEDFAHGRKAFLEGKDDSGRSNYLLGIVSHPGNDGTEQLDQYHLTVKDGVIISFYVTIEQMHLRR